MSDIVRVGQKVKAFRQDHPADEYAILTSFTEDEVGGVGRVVGCCKIVKLASDQVVAEAYGTRALRAPKPGAQGHQDTRDPDRAMTQAVGRALGLLGYGDGESLEGDTDEPDHSEDTAPVRRVDGKKAAFLEAFNGLASEHKNEVLAWLKERGHRPTTIPPVLVDEALAFIEARRGESTVVTSAEGDNSTSSAPPGLDAAKKALGAVKQ